MKIIRKSWKIEQLKLSSISRVEKKIYNADIGMGKREISQNNNTSILELINVKEIWKNGNIDFVVRSFKWCLRSETTGWEGEQKKKKLKPEIINNFKILQPTEIVMDNMKTVYR